MEYKPIESRVIIWGIVILGVLYIAFNGAIAIVIHSKNNVVVPDIQGKSSYEALTMVSAQGLGLKKESEEFNKSVPAGVVLRQNPLPGMMVKDGKVVRIILSQGGESSFVPDLIGQKSRSAALTIRSYGLVLGEESSRYSVVYDKDTVVAQDPPKGTSVDKDTMVNVVVSLGAPPQNVKLMPKFIGRKINDVTAWAENNDLSVSVTKENVSSAASGTVLAQNPQADEDVTNAQHISVKIVGMPDIPPEGEPRGP